MSFAQSYCAQPQPQSPKSFQYALKHGTCFGQRVFFPAIYSVQLLFLLFNIKMSSDEFGSSPPQYGRIARLRGFLPLSSEDTNPMATHGQGTLTSLIKSRSTASLQNMSRRPSSLRGGRDTPDVEEAEPQLSRSRTRRMSRDADTDDYRSSEERRLSAVLLGPQMRSQRLIGNSNPRYRWDRYWKTEEELKKMKKPM